MSVTPSRLATGQLTTSAVIYHTASSKSRIDACVLTNTSAVAADATIHLVPSGGTPSDANCILFEQSVAAGASFIVPGAIGQWIEAGGTLQALASAADSITLVASGVLYS